MKEGVGGKPVEANQEVENGFTLDALVSQLNYLTTKKLR